MEKNSSPRKGYCVKKTRHGRFFPLCNSPATSEKPLGYSASTVFRNFILRRRQVYGILFFDKAFKIVEKTQKLTEQEADFTHHTNGQ